MTANRPIKRTLPVRSVPRAIAAAAALALFAGASPAIAQSTMRSLGGESSVTIGRTRDVPTVQGSLLITYLIVSQDVLSEKKGDVLVRSLKQMGVSFRPDTGLRWDAGSVNWTFYVDEKQQRGRHPKPLTPQQALGSAKFGDQSENFEVASLALVGGSSSEMRTAKFKDLVFRRDGRGGLVLGAVTAPGSQVVLPARIVSLTPCLAKSFLMGDATSVDMDHLDASCFAAGKPFDSSTDAVLALQPDGSVMATGKLEYLLLGWQRMYLNVGTAAKLRIAGDNATVIELTDDQGNVIQAGPGLWVHAKGTWKRTGD